jgi:hypothetical protein
MEPLFFSPFFFGKDAYRPACPPASRQEPAHPYQVIKDPERYLNPRFRDPRRNPPERDA